MNKRIVELKNQTLDKHFWYTWSTMDYHDVTRFAEKFAELILKECMTLFENAKVNQEDDVDYGLEEAQNIIKEHFGVDNK